MLAKFSKYKLDQLNPVDQVAVSISDYEYQLSREPHIVTLNFNLPCVKLYLTKIKGVNRCIYEDSKGQLTTAYHRFSDDLYEADTVFIGYMITEMNTYMIEDLLVHQNQAHHQHNQQHNQQQNQHQPLKKEPIDKRLGIINNIVNLQYTPDPVLESTKIVVKDYVEYEYLASFYDEAIKKPYAPYINGLRFCSLVNGKQIIINSDTKLRLMSPRSMAAASEYENRHQIVTDPVVDKFVFNVRVTAKPDVYELYCFNKAKKLKYYDIACIPDMLTSKKVKQMLGRMKEATVACVFNREFGRWTPSALSNEPPQIWDTLNI